MIAGRLADEITDDDDDAAVCETSAKHVVSVLILVGKCSFRQIGAILKCALK